MKRKTVVLLVAGTLVFSSMASLKLSAKDLEADGIETDSKAVSERKHNGDNSQQCNKDVSRQDKKLRPHMDLAFCIDTTGSMQGEIDMVKAKVKDLVAKLCSGKPAPVVRVGLVAFRDRGDEYVTKLYPFTDDIDKFVKDISDLKADGGGDGPEAVNQALHAAVADLSWDKSKKTAKILFLIGDAAPKLYPNDYKWETEAKTAIASGIQINTIGCDGLESYGDQGVKVFEQIAKLADGNFERLSYRQVVKTARGEEKTYVTSGGATYELSAASKGDWKRGALELAKAGKAKAVATSEMRYGAAPADMRSLRAGYSATADAVSSGVPTAAAAPAPVAASYAGGYSGSVNRKDSNLDSVMYDAAMKRAGSVLKVEYGK